MLQQPYIRLSNWYIHETDLLESDHLEVLQKRLNDTQMKVTPLERRRDLPAGT